MSTWPPPPRGYYQPGTAFPAASALRWVPYDVAVSAVQGLLGASYEDLRRRVQQLSQSLNGVFFHQLLPTPFAVRERFAEETLYVCVDRPPLATALLAVNRAMMTVAATDAGHGACDHFYDTVEKLMQLLVVDGGVGPAVMNQEAFESAFALEWVLQS